jgi:hypothetical protein
VKIKESMVKILNERDRKDQYNSNTTTAVVPKRCPKKICIKIINQVYFAILEFKILKSGEA